MSNGTSIAYHCQRSKGTEESRRGVLARFDIASGEETDLVCLDKQPLDHSCGPSALGFGSTGLVYNHVLGAGNCGKRDALFRRFGSKPYVVENLSNRGGSVFMTHMAGPYAVWTEINPAYGLMNIALYDTRTKQKIYAAPNPRSQFMPRTDGRYVVWADSRNDPKSSYGSWKNTDIYRYDIQTKKVELVSNNGAQQLYPDVAGKWVTWEDSRNDPISITPGLGRWSNQDIYARDMDSGKEYQITSSPALELQPRVDAGRLVYRALDAQKEAGLFLVDLKAFVASKK